MNWEVALKLCIPTMGETSEFEAHVEAPKDGQFYWGGIAGTQWWISPKANAAGILMTQRQMAFAHPFAVEFKRLAYQAVSRAS
jgi:CubicO group peptidase (beta-lactamase class C family)